MNDEEVITKAQSVGFLFHKHKNSWKWSVIAPDNDGYVCEQGDVSGMKWLREKLTHFIS